MLQHRVPDSVSCWRGQFSGRVKETAGKPWGAFTFAPHKDQEGGAPIWLEAHNVPLDGSGRYTVLLGATTRRVAHLG